MSGYDNSFDFNAFAGAYNMPGSLDAEPAPAMDQSGAWNSALPTQSGLVEGGTASQLHAQVDFAPFEGARSNQIQILSQRRKADIACASCLATFQTAFALDTHAKEATHQAYKCKCGTGFNKHSALQRHINTKDATNTFACTLCSDKFTRKDKLRDHYRNYHRVTDDGLLILFNSQQVKPRPGAPSRRRRGPVPLAAASSAPAPALAPAPPTLAPASAGPSVWSFPVSTGQHYVNFSAGLFVPPGPFVTTGSSVSSGAFVPAADQFTATPALGEDISGIPDDIFGDETWATGFDGFGF